MTIQSSLLAEFVPQKGAAGFQVGNPSALAISSLLASLEVFEQTSMEAIRAKSLKITAVLERLLVKDYDGGKKTPYWIITPSNPEERGAQLSVQLEEGLLDPVMHFLEEKGVVIDERKPDVIRVAPAPLYNSYMDVYNFSQIFREACQRAKAEQSI